MITGAELRRRVDRLDLTYAEAAKRLGLSLSGLNHQMRGDRPVSPQTEIILMMLESLLTLNTAGRQEAMRQMERLLEPAKDREFGLDGELLR